jgi:hypothetical protein
MLIKVFDFIRFDPADWILNNQDGRIGSTECFALRVCDGFKRVRDDGEPAAFL